MDRAATSNNTNRGDLRGGRFPAITPGKVPAQAEVAATGGLDSEWGTMVAACRSSKDKAEGPLLQQSFAPEKTSVAVFILHHCACYVPRSTPRGNRLSH